MRHLHLPPTLPAPGDQPPPPAVPKGHPQSLGPEGRGEPPQGHPQGRAGSACWVDLVGSMAPGRTPFLTAPGAPDPGEASQLGQQGRFAAWTCQGGRGWPRPDGPEPGPVAAPAPPPIYRRGSRPLERGQVSSQAQCWHLSRHPWALRGPRSNGPVLFPPDCSRCPSSTSAQTAGVVSCATPTGSGERQPLWPLSWG